MKFLSGRKLRCAHAHIAETICKDPKAGLDGFGVLGVGMQYDPLLDATSVTMRTRFRILSIATCMLYAIILAILTRIVHLDRCCYSDQRYGHHF